MEDMCWPDFWLSIEDGFCMGCLTKMMSLRRFDRKCLVYKSQQDKNIYFLLKSSVTFVTDNGYAIMVDPVPMLVNMTDLIIVQMCRFLFLTHYL